MASPSTGLGSLQHAAGLRGFLRGASYPFRGIRFLAKRPPLWGLAAIPTILTIFLLLAFSTTSLFFIDDLKDFLLPDSWDVEAWGGTIARSTAAALATVLCLLAAVLLAFLMAPAISGPFNELLSETTEALRRGEKSSEGALSFKRIAAEVLRGTWNAIQRAFLFVVIYLPLVIASFLPVVGILFLLLSFLYSAFFLSMTFMEPVHDRHRMLFSAKLVWARRRISAFMGFGLSSVLLLLVPCLSLIMTPALIVGATLLWVDTGGLEGSKQIPGPDETPA
ncbi:MAG: EI24 domain-containing protein [Myxococcota bacterium]|nr:EI24 domain-containing protein [Myxococcota bacterium]